MSSKPKGYTPNLTITTPWGMGMLAIIAAIIGLLAAGLPNDWKTQEGFLGSSATLMSDVTVLAYILLLVPMMIAGFVFARNKQFVPYHQVTMTTILLLNWGLISFIMAASLRDTLDAEGLDQTSYRYLPLLHAAFGLTGQLLGTYLVIRMWFEDSLPAGFKIKKIKTPMRFTLACWLIAATLGIVTYVTWYDPFSDSSSSPAPEATPEVTAEPTQEAETSVTAEPAQTEEAAATSEPVETEETVATSEPAETEEPEASATEPVETEEPAETQEPEETDAATEPVETEEPVETAEPVETEEVKPTSTTPPTAAPRPSSTPRPTQTAVPTSSY